MDLESFLKIVKEYDIEGLENVEIDGDLEIELTGETIQNLQSLAAYIPVLQELQNFLYHANMALAYVSKFANLNAANEQKE